jgi:hypothetical protein
MTNEHLEAILTKYEEYLSAYGVPLRYAADRLPPDETQAARHVLWMCGEVRKFMAEGRAEKANRWFGFIQGVMWKMGRYTIDDMRGHNTAPPED